jgi:hypothetical protein
MVCERTAFMPRGRGLMEIVDVLAATLRLADAVARLSGDEFCVLHVAGPEGVAAPRREAPTAVSYISSGPAASATPNAAWSSDSNSPATSGPGRKSSTGGSCASELSPRRSKNKSVVP